MPLQITQPMRRKIHYASVQRTSMAHIERERFIDLYDQYAERVYRFLCTKVSSIAEAEDLTSQTFMKAWQAYPTLRDPDRFPSWVFTIARNIANDFYRKSRPITTLLDETYPDPVIGPAQNALAHERQQHLLRLVSALLEEEQELITLRYLGELSFRQIAQVQRRSESAVKKQHARLLARLKSQLE